MKRVVLVWRWTLPPTAALAAVRAWRGTADRWVTAMWLGVLVLMLTVEAIDATRKHRRPAPAAEPVRTEVEVAPGVLITVTAPPGADEADALAYVHDVVARIREAGR